MHKRKSLIIVLSFSIFLLSGCRQLGLEKDRRDLRDVGTKNSYLKEHGEIIQEFNKLVARIYYFIGDMKLENRNNDQDIKDGIKYLDKAILLNQNFAILYHERGLARQNLDDYKGALSDFNRAIELDPKDNNETYFVRGMTKSDHLNDYTGSIQDFNKGIVLHPNLSRHYLYYRGIAKGKIGDHTGAIQDFDTVLIESHGIFHRDIYRARGAEKIFIKKIDEGCLDLQKASKYGNPKVDDLIKQFCK